MEFPQILAQLRTETNTYQKELASLLNLSIGTISNYESGVHAPDLVTLCRIADFYGVTTDYLLGRTKYKYPLPKMNLPIAKDYTVGDLVNTTLELRKEDRRAIADYVSLLKLRKDLQSPPDPHHSSAPAVNPPQKS